MRVRVRVEPFFLVETVLGQKYPDLAARRLSRSILRLFSQYDMMKRSDKATCEQVGGENHPFAFIMIQIRHL